MQYIYMNAQVSQDRIYRYTLERRWGGGELVTFIALNPSTADHRIDDATVRRLVGFSFRWGFGGFALLNLFALRSRDPEQLRVARDPVGPENDSTIQRFCRRARLRVCCWGSFPMARERGQRVRSLIGKHAVLGFTRDGHPRHPLYLSSRVQPLDSQTLRPVPLPMDEHPEQLSIGL